MRKAARLDSNHAAIVKTFQACGVRVLPDLPVGAAFGRGGGRIVYSCAHCGVLGDRKRSEVSPTMYCSVVCRLAARAVDRSPRACGQCGTSFIPHGKARGIYCSRYCAGSANGRLSSGYEKLNSYVCQQCSKPFSVYHKVRRFCSSRCAGDNRVGKRMSPAFRRGCRSDLNQREIIEALEKSGCAVLTTSSMGGGVPDLVVCYQRVIMLLEVKNRKTYYGRQGMNKNQKEFAAEWAGAPIFVVYTAEEAISTVRGYVRGKE